MKDQTIFDLESFQNDVLSTIQDIEIYDPVFYLPNSAYNAFGISSPSESLVITISRSLKNKHKKGEAKDKKQIEKEALEAIIKDKKDNDKNQIEKEALEVVNKAGEVVRKKDIKKILCPALQSVSNDAYDIAKIITPILVPLVLAGTISVPLNPLLFATIALIFARMGIASMCAENKKSPEVKSGA